MRERDPTKRFSSRVDHYVRYRPRYPKEVLDIIREECGLEPPWTIADIGSGTGFLAELFLENGNRVIGVEPNREMRAAGEICLRDHPGFSSIEGTAEATTLPGQSIDLIVADQAFHWFDPEKSRIEFNRILKPGGRVALIRNERRIEDDPVRREYEDLIRRFGTDYESVGFRHKIDEAVINRFFEKGWQVRKTENVQSLDYKGFEGRLLSTSYTPEPGADGFEGMLTGLHTIFDRHHSKGVVEMTYWTRVYCGEL